MVGETLLKFVTVLKPDEVRRLKAAGCEDGVRGLLKALDGLTAPAASLYGRKGRVSASPNEPLSVKILKYIKL